MLANRKDDESTERDLTSTMGSVELSRSEFGDVGYLDGYSGGECKDSDDFDGSAESFGA